MRGIAQMCLMRMRGKVRSVRRRGSIAASYPKGVDARFGYIEGTYQRNTVLPLIYTLRLSTMGASADQGDVVFVSYNRKDSETAHAIAAQLEQRGVRMWTDRQVRPGDTWMDQLGSAIMRARAAIVFKGPNGFGPWQSQEV